MRIAVLNSIRAYGGGEKWIIRATRGLRERGDEVTILCAPGSELEGRCRTGDIPTLPVPYPHDLSPVGVWRIAGALRSVRPDVVLACNERAGRLAAVAMRLPGLRKVPLVYRNGLEASFKNKAHNRLIAGPRITCYVGNAEALRREFLGFGWIPAEKVHVIYNGVDPTPLDTADPTGVREKLGAGAGDVVVLTAARLVREKGHPVLLRALTGIAPELRPQVWLAGDGPEAEHLARMVEELGLGRWVQLLGFRTDIPRLMKAADVLCHPSRREGAPNGVLEAMVAGLPVVAADASGTSELVLHESTGLLSPPEDEAALRANLERVLTDPELRRELGGAGRERALQEFSEARSLDAWQKLLRECR